MWLVGVWSVRDLFSMFSGCIFLEGGPFVSSMEIICTIYLINR